METISSALTAPSNGELLPEQVKSIRWTEEHDQRVKAEWGKLSAAKIGEQIGKSKKAVLDRARRLHLASIRRTDVAKAFGLSPNWTEQENQFLRDNWGKLSAFLIAAEMSRSRSAVIGRAYRLGLAKLRQYQPGKATKAPVQRKRYTVIHGVSVPEPTPIIDLQIPFEQRKTFLQLERGDCRWPVGDPGKPDFFFCGGKAFGEHSYCAAHYHRAHTPYRPQRSGFQFRRAA